MVNAGTSNTSARGSLSGFCRTTGAGNICVSTYVFNPSEELLNCCTCPLRPNELISLADIGSINGAPAFRSERMLSRSKTSFNSAVIKLVTARLWGTAAIT